MALVVITGNRRGLGAALTKELERLGHTVVGCSASASGPDQVDVSERDEVEGWARRVLAQWGAPDYLVNNAAVVTPLAPLWEQSASDVEQILRVNILGVSNVLAAFVPAMLERGQGVIVNISSGWGRTTSPRVAPYCASKWAIEGLTRSLAQELPKGVGAVTLDPGTINTDMLAKAFGPASRHYPDPADWAKVAAPFLLSIQATHNGRALSVPKVEPRT